MPYSTQTDLASVLTPATLVQLTDDDGDGVADAAVVTAAIAAADGVIDSFLAARYTVPLSPVPVVIKEASKDLAAWNLYGRRGLGNEVREKRAKAVMDYLRSVSRGEATLGETPGRAAAEAGGPQATRNPEDRTFTIGDSTGPGTLDNY